VEYRIEQLGQATGVAVDTIRFYQGKGLLEAPRREGRITWYGEVHLARLRRIRSLQERGFSLAVIRRFLVGELEPSDEALVEAVTAPAAPATLSIEELAGRSGVAVPFLRQLEAAGLLRPIAAENGSRFAADDLELLAAGLRLVGAGVPLSALIDLATRHAAGIEATAAEAVALFDNHVRGPLQAAGGEPTEVEGELLATFKDLLEASGLLVRAHFERVLLRAARDHIEGAR
jgi:DNA-binding transcriptional MerR regulator